ncbi:hypothetical protein ASE92_12540 [Pedobacter sp. Leaf41]|nr:hypothetical protein ASE92_12540 [Pedobacter sp. Leaf41]
MIKSKSIKTPLQNETYCPLYWHLLQDLRGDQYAPWNDLLSSELVDPKDIAQFIRHGTYTTQDDYDSSSDSYIRKEYPIGDLLFVYWQSPQKSWDHLAGRAGYVVISKSEKKQIDFIMTVIS